MPAAVPTSLPFGRTARRLEWAHLPPHVRRLVEQRFGSPVVDAQSQPSGFTPGFASVLTTAAGTRHFVKAASTKAQRMFAAAYREEARKLAALPAVAPAAHLRWLHDADDWVALETEHVDGRHPVRPWDLADLDAALDALEVVADELTPAPAALDLPSFEDDHGGFVAYWDDLRADPPALPGFAEHLEEAAALAATGAPGREGTTLVHGDLRDDNLLLRPDGTAVLCDWNYPTRGAAWLDTVMLMIGPRGDGHDVDAVLAARRLTRDLPAADLDAFIALVTGYFLRQSAEPVPPTSPYLRRFQRWQGDVCWMWLAERRAWI